MLDNKIRNDQINPKKLAQDLQANKNSATDRDPMLNIQLPKESKQPEAAKWESMPGKEWVKETLRNHPHDSNRLSCNYSNYPHKEYIKNPLIYHQMHDRDRLKGMDYKLNDTDIKLIVSFIESNPFITSLDLDNNQIGSNGAKAIAKYLQDNQSLTRLTLYNNPIEDEGAEAILTAIQRKYNTTLIYLHENNCSQKLIKKIKAHLDLPMDERREIAKDAKQIKEQIQSEEHKDNHADSPEKTTNDTKHNLNPFNQSSPLDTPEENPYKASLEQPTKGTGDKEEMLSQKQIDVKEQMLTSFKYSDNNHYIAWRLLQEYYRYITHQLDMLNFDVDDALIPIIKDLLKTKTIKYHEKGNDKFIEIINSESYKSESNDPKIIRTLSDSCYQIILKAIQSKDYTLSNFLVGNITNIAQKISNDATAQNNEDTLKTLQNLDYQLGQYHFNVKNYNQAIKYYNLVLDAEGNKDIDSNLLDCYSKILLQENSSETIIKALDSYTNKSLTLKKNSNAVIQACHNIILTANKSINNNILSKSLMNNVMNITKNITHDISKNSDSCTKLQDLNYQLGQYHFNVKNYHQAIKYYELALNNNQKYSNEEIIEAYYNLSASYEKLNQHEKSLDARKELLFLKIASDTHLNDLELNLELLLFLASEYAGSTKIPVSERSLLKTIDCQKLYLKHATSIEDFLHARQFIVRIYSQLVQNHEDKKIYSDNALQYATSSLYIANKIYNAKKLIISRILSFLSDNQSASDTQNLLDIKIENTNNFNCKKTLVGDAYQDVGIAYKLRKNFTEAMKYHIKAYKYGVVTLGNTTDEANNAIHQVDKRIKPISKQIEDCAANGQWEDQGINVWPFKYFKKHGVKYYTSEKYLSKLLGELNTPENLTIAKETCMYHINTGIELSNEKNLKCFINFIAQKTQGIDFLYNVFLKHSHYFSLFEDIPISRLNEILDSLTQGHNTVNNTDRKQDSTLDDSDNTQIDSLSNLLSNQDHNLDGLEEGLLALENY